MAAFFMIAGLIGMLFTWLTGFMMPWSFVTFLVVFAVALIWHFVTRMASMARMVVASITAIQTVVLLAIALAVVISAAAVVIKHPGR